MSNNVLQEFLDRLIEFLCLIRALRDRDNRDSLLKKLPSGPTGALKRKDAYAGDLRIIVETAASLGKIEPGDEYALEVVISNAFEFVKGVEQGEQLQKFKDEFIRLISSTAVTFANRRREIDDLYHKSSVWSQSWAIDGPAGYGKTELMIELQRCYENEKNRRWACGYVEIPRGEPWDIRELSNEMAKSFRHTSLRGQPQSTEAMGRTLAGMILGDRRLKGTLFKGVAMFLDNVDALDLDTLKRLSEMTDGVREGLDNAGFWQEANRFRLFFGGRYISTRLKDIATPYVLSPFNFEAVRETVGECALKAEASISSSNADQIAASLLYMTGGHPGAMAQLLRQVALTSFSNAYDVLEEEQKSHKIIRDVIAKIEGGFVQKGGNKEILSILQTLSVFRQYRTLWLLNPLIKQGLIHWNRGGEQLERDLQNTRLVAKDRGFLHDDITRRLLVIRLRDENREHFGRICEAGLPLYGARLNTPRKPELIAIEWLYQKLQYGYFFPEKLGTSTLEDNLESAVARVLEILGDMEEGQDRIGDLLDEMERNWEFQFSYNFFLSRQAGHPYSSQPYKDLVKRIQSFQQGV